MTSGQPIVIDVKGLSKTFILSGTEKRAFDKRFGNHTENQLRVLSDINFSIEKGSVCGVIGVNGSGKSTLLKIIGEILKPDTGTVMLDGRVAAILELGTGFHPELSGRENIFFNATILGYDKKTVLEVIDDIIAFSELGQHIEFPVKHYSSGMFMRLAFSIVLYLKAEILLLDEIFSVGDPEFRLKCITKIRELSNGDITVMFVSHDLNQIKTLCNECLLVDQGKILKKGPTGEVLDQFISMFFDKPSDHNDKEGPGNYSIWHASTADSPIKSVSVMSNKNNFIYTTSEPVLLTFTIEKTDNVPMLFSMVLNYGFDMPALAGSPYYISEKSFQANEMTFSNIGTYEFLCEIPACLLNEGNFMVDLFFVNDAGDEVLQATHVAMISVRKDWPKAMQEALIKSFPGPLFAALKWTQKQQQV